MKVIIVVSCLAAFLAVLKGSDAAQTPPHLAPLAFLPTLSGRGFVKPASRMSLRQGALSMSSELKITVKKADEKDKEIAEDWPTWGCGVSKFPWSYDTRETCVVLQGEVIVTPNGGGEPVTIKAGDKATFPAGLSCTWDVRSPLKKHYNFG